MLTIRVLTLAGAALLLSVAMTAAQPGMRIPLIVDTDANNELDDQHALVGKAGRLIGQPIEGRHKESGDKVDEEAECHLRGDQGVHQASPGVRIFSTFQSAGGLYGRCA